LNPFQAVQLAGELDVALIQIDLERSVGDQVA
jgi:hypothetical protein